MSDDVDEMLNSCCCDSEGNSADCILCGKPLIYFTGEEMRECAICHREKPANAECEDEHFVCDDCHSGGGAAVISCLLQSAEKDPVKLFLEIVKLKSVHMHGPEHHGIVPCVLLTAYKNNGGDIDLAECLNEAWARGKKVPGGACGFLGICGAATGAGIFASILTDSTPLAGEVWHLPQSLAADALSRMVSVGGPRCCKRTGRLAIEAAADFSKRQLGVEMPVSSPRCVYPGRNRECLREKCPYFEGGEP